LTVERPIEIQFEGFHGDGYVEQIDASPSDFRTEVAAAMRKFPTEIKSMFFFGEVLEEAAAAELTRLIGRGHLVITTIHARDIISSIEMLVSFAEQGGERYARQLIGTNLLAVVHQQLVNRRPVINAVRINETMKNIICNSDTNLFMLSNELDLVKRQKYGRRASDRADPTGANATSKRTVA
jgi:Tfp pilus assembly pilus retraction ATPase PilT